MINFHDQVPRPKGTLTLTATNGAIDVLTYVVASTGTYAICSMGKAVS